MRIKEKNELGGGGFEKEERKRGEKQERGEETKGK